jgi:hypothetical protein
MDVTPAAHAAALWVGLNLVLLLVLSVRVVRLRRRHGVVFGDGEVADLAQAVRAFGNATEYVPAALIGVVVLAVLAAPPLLVHAAGLLLFAGRVAHAWGLSRSGGASLPRAIGVVATWLAYIVVAAALIFYAVP